MSYSNPNEIGVVMPTLVLKLKVSWNMEQKLHSDCQMPQVLCFVNVQRLNTFNELKLHSL